MEKRIARFDPPDPPGSDGSGSDAPGFEPALLLDWYRRHHRPLPWRAQPGQIGDPYRVWLSEIMLQQTTVAAVKPYFEAFCARWPNVEALAGAAREDVLAAWAGLGYYARARNLYRCAVEIAARGGRFPETEAELRELPGIGPYTAAAIAAQAFGRRSVAVDGNVERLMARFSGIEVPLPEAKPILRDLADRLTPAALPKGFGFGDWVQALIELGATVCQPHMPRCDACPLAAACRGRESGRAADLPVRRPKRVRPVRYGAVFLLFDDRGRIALETRPESGLLGGMWGLPGTAWAARPPTPAMIADAAPCRADWRVANETVRHVFTHFALELSVRVARCEDLSARAPDLVPSVQVRGLHAPGLPTVMKKAVRAGLRAMQAVPDRP